MDNATVLTNLLLCGLLGLIGQGVRVIVGLKKLREEATSVADSASAAELSVSATPKAAYNQLFDAKELWLSLFIGFVAGCLASFVSDKLDLGSTEVRLGIMAAGYAGTDFIEGIFK